MRAFVAVVLAVLACAPPDDDGLDADSEAAGDGVCGDVQCNNGLRVSLVAEGGVFVGGRYEVHVSADGTPQVCAFRIEAEPDECGGDPPCLSEDECGLLYSFSALPHSVAFVVGPEPTLIEVGIVRDGVTIGGETLAPTYDDFAPNGADCPPLCQVASAELGVR